VLHPETRDEYLAYDLAGNGTEWKSFWFHVGNFESLLPERVAGAPQVRTNWSSAGPGGKQVECILRTIEIFKNKGVTSDHVVFSFVSRRIQPLQRRKHPAFRYEGTKDPTRLSPEAMAHSEVVRRCCKVLDNFHKSLKLPALFSAVNPPESTWVSVEKDYQVLVDMHFDLFDKSLLSLQKNYKTWYCMPPTSEDTAPSDDSKKWKANPGALLQRKIPRLDSGQ
jgi:hypothetical protein